MRSVRLSALLLGLVVVLGARDHGPAPAADAFVQKDLVVHEWGVLSAFPDVETANADMRDEWDALPKFVFGQIDGRITPASGVLMQARLPVIHLYSPTPVDVNVRVDFPSGGKPLVWWPENVNNLPDYRTGRSRLRGNFLEWQVQVKSAQAGNLQMQPLPSGHWMNALRTVKSEDLVVTNLTGNLVGKERFLYYDGLVPSPRTLDVIRQKDQLVVKNRMECTVADVTVIDRRTAGKTLVARLAALDAGTEKPLTFAEADAKEWPDRGVQALAEQLKGAGLFEDESKVIADVWKKSFFESDGVTAFYRLPASEYDRLLPLTVNPRPEKVQRVMLVHQPRCEPELAEQVQKLIDQLSAKEFPQRVAAQKQLTAIGKAAMPFLVKAAKDAADPEVRMRLAKLLENYEVKLPAAK